MTLDLSSELERRCAFDVQKMETDGVNRRANQSLPIFDFETLYTIWERRCSLVMVATVCVDGADRPRLSKYCDSTCKASSANRFTVASALLSTILSCWHLCRSRSQLVRPPLPLTRTHGRWVAMGAKLVILWSLVRRAMSHAARRSHIAC